MKVFDLQCDQGHVFEGWFGSHEDYDAQHERGLVSCPVCGSHHIERRLSAPRLNVSHLKAPADAPAAASPAGASLPAAQAQWMQQMRTWLRQVENVGTGFAQEARRIHEGDADERPIRGTATPEERRELADEGIDFVALPDVLDEDRMQ